MPKYIFSSASDIVKFGKFKGKTLADVMFCSRGYFRWMSENLPPSFCTFTKQAIKELLMLKPDFDSEAILSGLSYEDYVYDPREDWVDYLLDGVDDIYDNKE